jgi:hypothetical protein
VMWTTNKGLTDRHTYDSRPESWIWLRRGIVSDTLSSCDFLYPRVSVLTPARIGGDVGRSHDG